MSALQRASYAIVFFDPESGAVLSVVRGTVPDVFPQTPAMAENFALAVVSQVAD